jgi:hypothetical protein
MSSLGSVIALSVTVQAHTSSTNFSCRRSPFRTGMLATTLPGAGPIGLDDPARPTNLDMVARHAGSNWRAIVWLPVGVSELACVEHDNVGLGIPPKRTV